MNTAFTQLLVVASIILLSADAATACTLAESLRDSDDRTVIIGKIQSYQAIFSDEGEIYGINVKPLVQLGKNDDIDTEKLDFLPQAGLGADCTAHYYTDLSRLKTRYPQEALVTIVHSNFRKPTDEKSVVRGAEIGILDAICDARHVANEQRDYSASNQSCGSYMFHGVKDVALLPASDQDARVSILTRLAEFPGFIYFEELVNEYVNDPELRTTLITARYSDAMEKECAERPEMITDYGEDYFQRRRIRGRWFEYCTDVRRKEARIDSS